MKQVTLHIPDSKYSLFMELVKSINFIKKIEEDRDAPTKEQILEGIRQGIREVNLIKAGKMKGIKAKDLLDEL
jgi:hypothetical protein